MKLTEEQLKTILERYSDMYHACVDAERVGCLDTDGPLYNAFWMGFESLLSIIDPHDWISWYIHDNDMGSKGHEVEVGSKMIKVKNLKTLLEVMNA